jgi:catechol 2,3-dioxygenase-like lactoylglutathione lyase family enzyme
MKLRVARHTKDLNRMIDFYGRILGLKVIDQFKDHDNYNGVLLGMPDLGWYLEFTISGTVPVHSPDEDDLLVFYANSLAEFQAVKEKFIANSVKHVEPKNPYWAKHGITFEDPDGFRIVLSIIIH